MKCTGSMAEKISFYFDEMMPRVVAEQVTLRGYDVIFAVDAGMTQKKDLTEHLVYAIEYNCVLATCDRPFARRAVDLMGHKGLVCWTGILNDFGGMVRKLTEFANQRSAEEVAGKVFWIK
jgi:hypothetical protein